VFEKKEDRGRIDISINSGKNDRGNDQYFNSNYKMTTNNTIIRNNYNVSNNYPNYYKSGGNYLRKLKCYILIRCFSPF
jgi:hypothetical protein